MRIRGLGRFVWLCSVAALAVTTAVLASSAQAATPAASDLSGIKTYLLGRSASLVAELSAERSRAERYYALAKAAGFDHHAMWQANRAEVAKLLLASKPGFDRAHGPMKRKRASSPVSPRWPSTT